MSRASVAMVGRSVDHHGGLLGQEQLVRRVRARAVEAGLPVVREFGDLLVRFAKAGAVHADLVVAHGRQQPLLIDNDRGIVVGIAHVQVKMAVLAAS